MTTILSNAKVFTAQTGARLSDGGCVIIKDSKIIFVGQKDDNMVRQALENRAVEHDLKGKTLAPGFIDG